MFQNQSIKIVIITSVNIAMCIYLLWQLYKQKSIATYYKKQQQVTLHKQQINQIKLNNKQLRKKIELLKNE